MSWGPKKWKTRGFYIFVSNKRKRTLTSPVCSLQLLCGICKGWYQVQYSHNFRQLTHAKILLIITVWKLVLIIGDKPSELFRSFAKQRLHIINLPVLTRSISVTSITGTKISYSRNNYIKYSIYNEPVYWPNAFLACK